MPIRIVALLTFGVVFYYAQGAAILFFLILMGEIFSGISILPGLIWFSITETVAVASFLIGRALYRMGEQ